MSRYIGKLPPGQLTWIGLRPERKAEMTVVQSANAVMDLGLEGDHRMQKTPGSSRQVTLISKEFIQLTAHYLNLNRELRNNPDPDTGPIDPKLLRRNLVVKGINLNALRHQKFQIGEAIFEANALCHPCIRMEHALGPGGLAAMFGYGGLCCKILQSGKIAVGDEVRLYTPQITLL
ncbi:MOSC domain-containing protein [Pseudomaricurvus hydrocarbonicus]